MTEPFEVTNEVCPAPVPVKGEVYRHYKGNEYKVLCLGHDEETNEELVVYVSMKDPDEIWIRKLDSWRAMIVDGPSWFPRFKHLA
jgi:hypothetical protein